MGLLDHDARMPSPAPTPRRWWSWGPGTCSPRSARRATSLDLLNDCELHVLPGAGHQLMQERPDELAALIDDFVRRLPADDPCDAGRRRLTGWPLE